MDRFTALVISTVVSVWIAAPEDEVSAMCAGVEAASLACSWSRWPVLRCSHT